MAWDLIANLGTSQTTRCTYDYDATQRYITDEDTREKQWRSYSKLAWV